MALIDITPVMTGNNTPTPYVINASSTFSGYYLWTAFDGNISQSANDCWFSNGITGFLIFDFGNQTKLDAFSIIARYDTSMTYQNTAPKDFYFYGSNDGTNFDLLYTGSDQILWLASESRLFTLKQQVNYRYYKLMIIANNGHASASGFTLLKFWQSDSINSSVTNKNASLTYCLPSNSTLAMIQRKNDSREGLLGFTNDLDNYGTLWMINNKGQAQIPMSKLKYDVIFDGNANTLNTEYIFSKSIIDYKKIVFHLSIYLKAFSKWVYGYSSTVDSNSTDVLTFNRYDDQYSNVYLNWSMISNHSFIISTKVIGSGGYSDIRIHKVDGIY